MHEKIVCHQTRQKSAQRGSVHGVNEHFKPFFNDVLEILVVMLMPPLIKTNRLEQQDYE